MTYDIKCPRCGKKIEDESIANLYCDQYDNGQKNWIKCEKCGTIFSLTQHYAPFYVINEVNDLDDDMYCGNVECTSNLVTFLKDKKDVDQACFHTFTDLPCPNYVPTKEQIKQYEQDTGEKYEEVEYE